MTEIDGEGRTMHEASVGLCNMPDIPFPRCTAISTSSFLMMPDNRDARWRLRCFRRTCANRLEALRRILKSQMYGTLAADFLCKGRLGQERALPRLSKLLSPCAALASRRFGKDAVAYFFFLGIKGSPIIDGQDCGISTSAFQVGGRNFDILRVPDQVLTSLLVTAPRIDLAGALFEATAALLIDRALQELACGPGVLIAPGDAAPRLAVGWRSEMVNGSEQRDQPRPASHGVILNSPFG
jgi:hypothetical protein